MRVLLLSRYGELGASSRLRSCQYLSRLKAAGISVVVKPLFSNKYLSQKYSGITPIIEVAKGYISRGAAVLGSHKFDLIWIEKELFPWIPFVLEKCFLPNKFPIVIDYDDAIFHRYDRNKSQIVRCLMRDKIDKIMRSATAVIVGNKYLADRASSAGAQSIVSIPTAVDLDRYPEHTNSNTHGSVIKIVWIGTKYTSKYLSLLKEPLIALQKRFSVQLKVIGPSGIKFRGVDVVSVPWSESTEVSSLQDCDIGVMPLSDSDWERGKCGYKLIQYMACSLPVVASPVGVNFEIVKPGENGFLASSSIEWENAFVALCSSQTLRREMGKCGRQQVERNFSVQVLAAKLEKVLREAAHRQ